MVLIPCRVDESFCSPTHKIVPHISWQNLPCHTTTKKHADVPSMVFFQLLLWNSWVQKHGSVIVNNIFAYFTLSLSTAQGYMIKERYWFSQINFFIEYFPHRIILANLVSSTYTDKNNPFSRCTNKHSQLETFSQPYFNKIFSNCLSHSSPAKR